MTLFYNNNLGVWPPWKNNKQDLVSYSERKKWQVKSPCMQWCWLAIAPSWANGGANCSSGSHNYIHPLMNTSMASWILWPELCAGYQAHPKKEAVSVSPMCALLKGSLGVGVKGCKWRESGRVGWMLHLLSEGRFSVCSLCMCCGVGG